LEEASNLSSDRILNDDLKDRRGYSHLNEEALDRTVWRNRFGGCFGPVVRQNTECMMMNRKMLAFLIYTNRIADSPTN
jgi:hypothetical protein